MAVPKITRTRIDGFVTNVIELIYIVVLQSLDFGSHILGLVKAKEIILFVTKAVAVKQVISQPNRYLKIQIFTLTLIC